LKEWVDFLEKRVFSLGRFITSMLCRLAMANLSLLQEHEVLTRGVDDDKAKEFDKMF